MKFAILLAIKGYQRYLSPYKGFHCAFHAHTGRNTCSGYAYRVIARYGSWRGWRLLQRRFAACGQVAQLHALSSNTRTMPFNKAEAGFVDCGTCDTSCGGDAGDACDVLGNVADFADCCSKLKGRGRKSCSDYDCGDFIRLLLLLALIAGAVYLAYYFFWKH